MMTRTALLDYLTTYLKVDAFKDYAPNGLQVEGRVDVRRIRTAVTASQAVIEQACLDDADALLVHHGYFWRGEPAEVCGMKRRRLGRLLQHDLNLLAYHLPVDCHPELGNNACMARRLGLENITRHTASNTPDLLWTGMLPKPVTAASLTTELAQVYRRTPQCILVSDKPIQHVAFCTGGAQDFIADAAALGVDAYLSGEVSERTYYQAHELGVHYFACGHHATERDGIQALGEHVAHRFGLEHAFIDSDNPI